MPDKTESFRGSTRQEAEAAAASWVRANSGIAVVKAHSLPVTEAASDGTLRQVWVTHVRYRPST